MTELYLDGKRVELGRAEIAQTYQINDLAEIENQQTNFTNRFRVPNTPHNVRIFDNLGVPGNTSRKAYQRIPAKLVEDGIELMSKGYAAVKSYNGYYDVVIYDGNISLAETLKGKRLNDLDYEDLKHDLSVAEFMASLDNDYQDGFIHAIADYGSMSLSYFNVDYNPGAIFVAWLWDKIFTESELQYSGEIFSKQKFLNAVVAPVRGFEVITETGPDTVLGELNTNFINKSGNVPLDTFFIIDEYFTWTGTTPSQMSNLSGSLRFDFTGTCKINLAAGLSLDTDYESYDMIQPRILLELNGNAIMIITEDNLNSEFTLTVNSGDTLRARVRAEFYPIQVTATYWLYANMNVDFAKVEVMNKVDYKDIMPDKSQLEFVKDIMQRFGLMLRKVRNRNEFEFIEMEELLNDRANAEDWSSKFLSRAEDYEIGDYARRNRFAYEYDEGVESFADGIMDVNNDIIEGEKTLFTSIFKATKPNRLIGSTKVYMVPLWERKEDGEGVVIFEPREDSLRIFEITRKQTTVLIKQDASSNVVSIPTSGGSIPFLDFAPCDYKIYVNTFYKTFKKVLDNSNKIEAELLLDPVDVYNIDFFRLKYFEQLGRYYYLNKVNNYRNGATTKCELIEVRDY